ncbi:NFX1-type zinc finger-containing protein 1 [Stylophora pistillata]|uniref:NFX1-type zinc finger-containing protein 1 n=1 Tax=Stylophora pistillata TaxID=50429 RepID=A0A2B4SP79_STYPI|nr:NFX1-type zinc finger-containing protein 1 [Stylophora pistillata]
MSSLQNAQSGKTTNGQTEKTDHGKKATIQSQRFSRKRKQMKDTSKGGSAVTGKSLTETQKEPISKYEQDDAKEGRGVQGRSGAQKSPEVSNSGQQDTTEEGGAQDTKRTTPKRRRPRTRRKKVKSEENSGDIPGLQNRLPGRATEGDTKNHGGIQDREQRHSTDIAGTVDSLSQSATEGQQSNRGKEGTKNQDSVRKNKQRSQKVKGRTNTADSPGGKDVMMAQSSTQADTMIGNSRKEEEVVKQERTSHQRNRRTVSKSATGESSSETNSRNQVQKKPQSLDEPKQTIGSETSQTVGKESEEKQQGVPKENNQTSERQSAVLNGNNNKAHSEKNRSENKPTEIPSSSEKKAKQAINRLESQRKPPSVKAMTDFLTKTPQEIVNWLIRDHLPMFKKRLKIKDEAISLLLKLLAKACDCKSSSNLAQLFEILSTSWLLNRRVLAVLNQFTWNKSKTSHAERFGLETIKEIAKLQTEILRKYPTKKYPVLEKLHGLVNASKLQDQGVISAVQEQRKLLNKEKVAQRKKEAVQKRKSAKADITDDNLKPPENFRVLSVIPTREDIISNQGQDEKLFLRKNKVQGRYKDEEHYLDVQFRLLREDFLRPLRKGIQHLMGKDVPDDTDDDNVGDVRVYKDVTILSPVCTSNGVAFKIRFDVTGFSRVRWENSKRLIFGSLLCLSKDDFKSFVFATVANRELSEVRKGEIEVQFVLSGGEAGIHTGDLCQMVESIAFFEAYRPVLEGLKTIPPGEFPFQTDVQSPAYLRKPGGQHVKFDFSPLISNEESPDYKWSPACVPKNKNPGGLEVSGLMISVLDPASWPTAEDLKLDDSQFNALQLALTKEFAVIQGPPGTGKTFIGLMITKILLHNISAWLGREGGPILVVCYTNHALDQFLEGIHEFHPEGIIRVGGRSNSETIQQYSLAKIKQTRSEERLTPAIIRKAYGCIKGEMKSLSAMIEDHEGILEDLSRTLLHENELVDYGMAKKHYDSLTRGSRNAGAKKKESVIPQWLGLPVEPADPYQGGFSQPLAMFPFNAECGGLEYFSQEEIAYISPRVRYAPGVDGNPGGSLELTGFADSFIEIPNWWGGFSDAGSSITLLTFIYPFGIVGPILSYDVHGYGVQLWHEGFEGGMGILTAYFIRRDLQPIAPLRAAVLHINEWNFIGASYDHDSGLARLWHNGNEVMKVFIGENCYLATQFPIRIGAFLGYHFAGRISHLHIYAESLTAENVQAVGGISSQETCRFSEEGDKEGGGNNKEGEGEFVNRGRSANFQFDADVLQNQRILETDEVTRFDRESPSSHLNTNDTYDFPVCANEGASSGNWQFQNSKRINQKIKRIIQRELQREDMMSKEEASEVEDVWNLSDKNRWRLYRRWMFDARETCSENISDFRQLYDDQVLRLKEVRKQEECEILKKADVIGMTTTGAARYHSLLQDIQPTITIVEEAAEVLEGHIVTSLTKGCKHLILIGDHQQLRPSPTVYDLQINYHLDVSLFERMVKNLMIFSRLSLQHRMRPEIAKMVDHIYVDPKLGNHDSVFTFKNIKGVEKNLFFVDHSEKENFIREGKSKSNVHEAKFLTALCRYFIQQGYQSSQITILTAYSGQLVEFRKEMIDDKAFFEGVRVTAVDNFQGEENDIILLSLVRSERIGFLKIANRVCVALSRAREGFYIIGNATLLAEEDPNLWAKIVADMREDGNLGSELKLVCQNHPQNVIHASCAEDFEDSPEGGCKEMCMMTLDCGHVCERVCHPIDLEHVEKFACVKPCTRTICDLQHICPKTCAEECGACMERVVKIIPKCNHKQPVPCSIDASTFKCREKVSKETSPCGHINEVECFMAPTDIICKEPCGKLECGHPCPVCDAIEFSESAPGAMFIELVDCGHVIEVGQLDKWMDGRNEADAQAGNDDGKVRYKVCPECSTPILYSRRYGKIVKEIHAEFEAIKSRVLLADVTSIDQIQRIRREAQEVKEVPGELLEDIAKCGTSGRTTCEEVNTCENQVAFLKFLGRLITRHNITKESSRELFDKINLLKARILMRRDCFSEQELEEFQNELLRTHLMVSFNGLTTALESKSVSSLCSNDVKTVESIRSALESGEVVDEEFSLLYYTFKTKNPEFPHGNYERFDLDSMNSAECKAEFRVEKQDLPRLVAAPVWRCEQTSICDDIEGLCILLKGVAFPCRCHSGFGPLVHIR